MRFGNTRTRFNKQIRLSWSFFSYVVFVVYRTSMCSLHTCSLFTRCSRCHPHLTPSMNWLQNASKHTQHQKERERKRVGWDRENGRERVDQFARISKMNVICSWKYFVVVSFILHDRNASKNAPDDSCNFCSLGGL